MNRAHRDVTLPTPDPENGVPLSPYARYRHDLAENAFVADPAQAQAVAALQHVYEALIARPPRQRHIGRNRMRWPKVRGLYLWGGVGRGKTWLMDAFFTSLPFTRKQRTHFHRFMLEVQDKLNQHRDEQDPLHKIAREIAGRVRVLCFDEFHVSDIADAMILGRLFDGLFARGVTLVATSNVAPDDLYRDGLQRERFLPAIEMLKRNTTVLNVDGDTDFRLRALHAAPLYLCPADETADAQLARHFTAIASGAITEDGEINLHNRSIPARRIAEGIAWFDFAALCEGPRGSADYVELARLDHTVVISGVPRFDADHEDAARRFITLVDEFYDRGVKLILSAAAPVSNLYRGERLRFEFERTASRLTEMQSREYLAKPHLP